MRTWTLWVIAAVVELVLLAIGHHVVATNASLSAGIMVAMTQLPGLRISQILLGETAPLWQVDTLMAVIQILVFGVALHILNFVWKRVRNRSAGEADKS